MTRGSDCEDSGETSTILKARVEHGRANMNLRMSRTVFRKLECRKSPDDLLILAVGIGNSYSTGGLGALLGGRTRGAITLPGCGG